MHFALSCFACLWNVNVSHFSSLEILLLGPINARWIKLDLTERRQFSNRWICPIDIVINITHKWVTVAECLVEILDHEVSRSLCESVTRISSVKENIGHIECFKLQFCSFLIVRWHYFVVWSTHDTNCPVLQVTHAIDFICIVKFFDQIHWSGNEILHVWVLKLAKFWQKCWSFGHSSTFESVWEND